MTEEIRRAADGFESLFVSALLRPLESQSSTLFGEGPQGRTVAGLFREQLAGQVASARPLGIAELIERELARRLPAEPAPAFPRSSHVVPSGSELLDTSRPNFGSQNRVDRSSESAMRRATALARYGKALP